MSRLRISDLDQILLQAMASTCLKETTFTWIIDCCWMEKALKKGFFVLLGQLASLCLNTSFAQGLKRFMKILMQFAWYEVKCSWQRWGHAAWVFHVQGWYWQECIFLDLCPCLHLTRKLWAAASPWPLCSKGDLQSLFFPLVLQGCWLFSLGAFTNAALCFIFIVSHAKITLTSCSSQSHIHSTAEQPLYSNRGSDSAKSGHREFHALTLLACPQFLWPLFCCSSHTAWLLQIAH